MLRLFLAILKGAAPGVRDGSQALFPNFIAEVLLLTQEVVLHPGLHRTAVQGLVMEVSHLRDPAQGWSCSICKEVNFLVYYCYVQPLD